MLFGMLSGEGVIDGPTLTECVQEHLVRYNHEEIVPLIADPHCHLLGLRSTAPPDPWSLIDRSVGTESWFFGLDRANRGDRADRSALASYDWRAPLRLSGCYVALRYRSESRSLELATDFLGIARVYVAAIGSNFLFSSDLGALVAFCRSVTIDRENLLMELLVGYSATDGTVFREISLLPPQSVVEFSVKGMTINCRARPILGDRYAGVEQKRKFAALDECLEAVCEREFRHNPAGLALSLSAGKDSRYALALLDREDVRCPLFTFGQAGSGEVVRAAEVAARVGQQTVLFEPLQASFDSWRTSIELQGNAGIKQWSGWVENYFLEMRKQSSAAIFGLMGDALSGLRLSPDLAEANSAQWIDYWVGWSLDINEGLPLIRAGAAETMRELVRERFCAMAATADLAQPHQSMVFLNLYGRQRIVGGGQPHLIARFLQPVVMFVDLGVVEFFTNLAFADLIDQRLYLAYAQDRFPQLFKTADFVSPPKGLLSLPGRVVRRLTRGPAPKRPRTISRDIILRDCVSEIQALLDRDPAGLSEFTDLIAVKGWLEAVQQRSIPDQQQLWLLGMVNVSLLAELQAEALIDRVLRR